MIKRTYDADIVETASRDGTFVTTLHGPPITASEPDPEYSLCHAIAEAGLPDGAIQFWRGTTRSLFYRSAYRAAGHRIGMGGDYPYRLAKRQEVTPEIFALRVRGHMETGETGLPGINPHDASRGLWAGA